MGKKTAMRKKNSRWAIIFLSISLIIFFLDGCGKDVPPETSTPTLVEQSVDPTPIKSKTIKPTSITIVPTGTPTPPYPALPDSPESTDPQDFQIVTPDAMDMLNLHEVGGDQVNYSYEVYDYEHEMFDALQFDAYNLGRIIDFELQRYYPEAVSHPLQILEEYSQESYRIIPKILFEVLEKGVLEYLDVNHLILEDGQIIYGPSFEATVYQIELDYDNRPEWVLQIKSEWSILTHITLNQNETGIYEVISSDLPKVILYSLHDEYLIVGIEDITEDGLSDIVIDYSTYMWGTTSGRFLVYMGNVNGLSQISNISWSTFDETYMDSSLEFPSDGSLPYLQIDIPNDINWGCEWIKSDIYRWPNGVEQLNTIGDNPPNTPECALAQAVNLLEPVDDQTAIKLLENAVYLYSVSAEKQFDLEVFARYRLAILYALYGNDSGARRQLETILSIAEDDNSEAAIMLVADIALLVEEANIHAVPLCEIVFLKIKQDKPMPSGWENYTTDTVAVHAYPAGFDPYPPAGCPLSEVLDKTLGRIDFNPLSSPENVFREYGLSVLATPLYLTNPDIPVWFVLIESGNPTIAAYFHNGINYQWEIMYKFGISQGSPIALISEDVTGDGNSDYAIAYEGQDEWWTGCREGKSLYQIFVTTKIQEGISVSFGDLICIERNESFDLKEYLADSDSDGLVDIAVEYAYQKQEDSGINLFDINEPWLTDAAISDYILSFADDEKEEDDVSSPTEVDLITLLINENTRDQARLHLLSARSKLTMDSLADAYLWQKYTYLIGLSYELEGNNNDAVKYYLAVLQSEVHTLWGNLVALKLTW